MLVVTAVDWAVWLTRRELRSGVPGMIVVTTVSVVAGGCSVGIGGMKGDPASGGNGVALETSIGIGCEGTGLPAGRFGESIRSVMLRSVVSGRKISDRARSSCCEVLATLRAMHAAS